MRKQIRHFVIVVCICVSALLLTTWLSCSLELNCESRKRRLRWLMDAKENYCWCCYCSVVCTHLISTCFGSSYHTISSHTSWVFFFLSFFFLKFCAIVVRHTEICWRIFVFFLFVFFSCFSSNIAVVENERKRMKLISITDLDFTLNQRMTKLIEIIGIEHWTNWIQEEHNSTNKCIKCKQR